MPKAGAFSQSGFEGFERLGAVGGAAHRPHPLPPSLCASGPKSSLSAAHRQDPHPRRLMISKSHADPQG